jgi:polar amino acid transport system permease protein
MEMIYNWFSELYQQYGINLSVFYDSYDRERFFEGLMMTLWLSVVSIVLSVVIGVVAAGIQNSRFTVLKAITNAYIQFFRNTPPLIQLYFFYFALGTVLTTTAGPNGGQTPMIGAVGWAIISLSFGAGAFNAEIFRSGIEAVPKTTIEAAEALAYNKFQTFIHVVLPLAFRFSLPALGNNLVNLVKTTTLAYAIAVPELLYVSAQIWSDALNVREMMTLLLVVYFLIVGALVWGLQRLEKALHMPGYGQ